MLPPPVLVEIYWSTTTVHGLAAHLHRTQSKSGYGGLISRHLASYLPWVC